MHRLSTSFVLGYHGCERKVGEALLAGKPFRASDNEYDWLGHGTYFWEANPQRALHFAEETFRRTRSNAQAVVVGAIIDLGLCLDLTTKTGIDALRKAHEGLSEVSLAAGRPLPKNSGDLLRRNLDCAVINFLHRTRVGADLAPVDTVRGIFQEGEPVYEGSAFLEKTHVQIAVRHLQAIKGVFLCRP